jgi:CheY-like chemotaxis protein
MPEMNGYEVLNELRKQPDFNNIKVIASSGDISKSEINKAKEAGFHDYITKPMRMENILDIVEKVLNGVK